jgi:hypothetical protein
MIRVIVGQFLPVMEAAVSDTSDRFITFSPYDADQLTVLGTLYAGPESTGYVVLKGNFDDIDAASSLPLVRQWIEDLQDEVVDLHAIAGNYEDEEDEWLTYSENNFGDDEEEEEDEDDTGEWNLYAGVWSDGGITSLEFDESFHELTEEAQIAILTDIATAAVAGVKAIRDAQDAE